MRQASFATLLGFLALSACGEDGSDPSASDGGSSEDGGPSQTDSGGADGSVDSGLDGSMIGSDAGNDASAGDAAQDSGPARDGGADAGPLTLGGFPVADHCAPGLPSAESLSSCEGARRTSALASGLNATTSTNLNVYWKALASPLVANQPFAFSIEVKLFPGEVWTLEVWGVDSPCAEQGGQATLLGSTKLNRGPDVYCVNMMPTKAFTHLMYVFRANGQDNGFAYDNLTHCSAGSCPVR